MSVDLGLVDGIERLAFRAFPPSHVAVRGGWVLRITETAPNRRVNSATTPFEVTDAEGDLDLIEQYYLDRDRPPVVRVLSVSPATIDATLASRGYALEAVTLVMTASVALAADTPGVVEVPDADWIAAKAAMAGMADDELQAWRRRIGTVAGRVGYAARRIDDTVAAIAMGVVDGGWLGIFDVYTRPSVRRSGHGRQATSDLLAWASRHGAERAYLQVTDDNIAAKALYRSLGFAEAYRYWYRRRPSSSAHRLTTS